MSKLKFAVIVITFNRPASLYRLINSLAHANYESQTVDLIISIDNSGNEESAKVADEFAWNYGQKYVIKHPKRLGLREHVLSCGEFLHEYDAVAVFEDDLIASPSFFRYMHNAVHFYRNDEDVAGISLYSPHWSEFHSRPFTPMKGSHDAYFMQYAQSWGQIWLKKQWFAFKDWYLQNKDIDLAAPSLPSNVSNWPNSSWLKYHIKYCIERGKFFVYPYISLSTNFTEIGHHNNASTTTYQVPMVYGDSADFSFPRMSLNGEGVFYDAYFERLFVGRIINISEEELCVDLYGKKDAILHTRYLLTMEKRDYKIVRSYGLRLRPHEMNAILGVPGESIFLYDTKVPQINSPEMDIDIVKWIYDTKAINYGVFAKLLIKKILSKLSLPEIWASIKHRISRR